MSSQPDNHRDIGEILPEAYDELRRLAAAYFRDQPSGHTLQPTAVVHEVWLKLAQSEAAQVNDETHFLVLAAKAMRQILVDHARARNAEKRGAGWRRVTLAGVGDEGSATEQVGVLELEVALEELARLNPDRAHLLELRYFGGLTGEQIATVLGVSRMEVTRRLRTTRLWLADRLARGDGG